MGRSINDLSGQKFGKLEVISFSHRVKTNTYYNCVCSCDEVIQKNCVVSSKSLNNGTISCGCAFAYHNKGKNNINWKGCGDLSLNFFNRYKLNAKSKNFEFSITIEYAWNLFEKQKGKCALTGLPLIFNKTFKSQTDRTASLDRIDSSIGYIEGNVQWVHKWINYFKKNIPNEMLVGVCYLITENNNLMLSKEQLIRDIETYKYQWNKKGKNQSGDKNNDEFFK